MTFASRTTAQLCLIAAFLVMAALVIHAPDDRRGLPTVQPLPISNTFNGRATAYCIGQRTATSVAPRLGIVASDPSWLPTGSIVALAFSGAAKAYDGVYSVLDVGGDAVVGAILDVYLPNCEAAKRFEKPRVRIDIIRRGWHSIAPFTTLQTNRRTP